MGTFTVIPQSTFDELQLDAGIVLKTFDPSQPAVVDANIVCATTGGITASCIPTYSDFGEDVDNCPLNMKELKHLDSWECKLAFTGLGTSPEMIRLSLGAADLSGGEYTLTSDTTIVSGKTYYTRSGTSPNYVYTAVTNPSAASLSTYYEKSPDNKVLPRRDLEQEDFTDLWWVGDKANGGFVAVQLKNALSTAGFSLKTTKNGKGQLTVELTGHVSISAQTEMPMEFYSIDGEGA